MSTYAKADESVYRMADSLKSEFETHLRLIDCNVKIDFIFAYGKRDEEGNLQGNAITHHGVRALGLAKKVSLKDRAMGRGDAEIQLDHDWWESAPDDQRRALLDHEMHHLTVKIDGRGVVRDDLDRPVIQMRKHDVEVGWFKLIAARHGAASQERIQAKQIADSSGQFFWPELCGELESGPVEGVSVTLVTEGKSVTVDAKDMRSAAARLFKAAKLKEAQ